MQFYWIYIIITFASILGYFLWFDKAIQEIVVLRNTRLILGHEMSNDMTNYLVSANNIRLEPAYDVNNHFLLNSMIGITGGENIDNKGGLAFAYFHKYLRIHALRKGCTYTFHPNKTVYEKHISRVAQMKAYQVLRTILSKPIAHVSIEVDIYKDNFIIDVSQLRSEDSELIYNEYLNIANSATPKKMTPEKSENGVRFLIPNY